MSFRLYVYYCAFCGGLAAYFGWVLGRIAAPEGFVIQAGVKGLYLGMLVAFGLGLVDTLANVSLRRPLEVALRIGAVFAMGCVGGFIGGFIGQAFFGWLHYSLFLVLGWMLTGVLIGASLGVFDVFYSMLRQEQSRGAIRKSVNGLIGGMAGGLLGGIFFLLLKVLWSAVFSNKPVDMLWSPGASGFVVLGMCIGLMIALAQVILKEAWVKVEQGFRAGRELILSKADTTVGRGESCDIGLFGDSSVERLHARIVLQEGRYGLMDSGTPGGTYLNGQRIAGLMPLKSGDLISVGNSVLRFQERQKRSA